MGIRDIGTKPLTGPLAGARCILGSLCSWGWRETGTNGTVEGAPQVMLAVQEVGRAVASTRDVDQVYERFASELKKLVDFDRVAINVVDAHAGTFTTSYRSGLYLDGYETPAVVPLDGTLAGQVVRTGQAHLREDLAVGGGLAGDSARVRAGLRSGLALPLFSEGRAIGTVAIHSRRVGAYGPREQAILELLADRIAPVLENSRLHQRLHAGIEERAVVDEVARIITSTLNIDQVYEKFAAEVRKLVDFDRVVINVISEEAGTYTPKYASGVHVEGRGVGAVVPLDGTMVELVLRSGRPMLRKDFGADGAFSLDPTRVRAGLRANLVVPLTTKGRTMGTLGLLSRRVGAYGPREQAILERLADQIAPAVENSVLYESLRKSEETNRAFMRAIPDLLFRVSRDGTFLDLSAPRPDRLYEGSREFIGKALSEVMPPDVARPAMKCIERALRTGEIQVLEYQLPAPDGARDSEARFVANGPDEVLIISRDVTERKLAEEELRVSKERFLQSQKMETVGKLAGGVAHDFNNQLTAILGYVQLGSMSLPSSHPVATYLNEIQKAAERASGLTQQLLAFSRRQPIDLRVVDLNELIMDMHRMLRRLIGENIEIVTVPTASAACVRVDRGQIENVLVNLAVNARDAMPAGGKLVIETANVDVDPGFTNRWAGSSMGACVRLTVTDTGTGMEEQVMSHIFEPFFTTKEVGKGTGLGLYTCRGIVKQYGGEIYFHSRKGRGTSFDIYLPLCGEAREAGLAEAGAGSLPRGTETVLLAEDEPVVRGLVADVLERQGYTVLSAADGEEALSVIERHTGEKVHLVITDVVMPRLLGPDLVERLRATHPDVKVIYISGYTQGFIGYLDLLDPLTDFLQKPFTPDTLVQKVRSVLDPLASVA